MVERVSEVAVWWMVVSGRQRGVLFGVLGSLMFGLSPVFIKLVLDAVNVETMNVVTTFFSALCFVVFFVLFKKVEYFRSILANWRRLALMSLFSVVGALLYTYGIYLYGPVNATFLLQFTPVFAIVFGVAFFHERFNRMEAAGILLAVVGVFVLAYGNLTLELVSTLVLLGAALFFATANTLSKVYVDKVNPVALAGGNAMFMLIFLSAYALLSGRLEATISSTTIVYAVLGGITGGVLSFAFFFKALKFLELSKASAIRTMEPFLTAIFSFFILALMPTANQLAGGALIVFGVVVLSLTKGKQTSSPKQNST